MRSYVVDEGSTAMTPRDWIIYRLGGVPLSTMRTCEEHLKAERAARAKDNTTWRRRKDELGTTVASRVKAGSPVVCPECGSLELQQVYEKPSKQMVRCIPKGHASTWGASGVLFEHEQRYRQRIKDEERGERASWLRQLDDLIGENKQLRLQLEDCDSDAISDEEQP